MLPAWLLSLLINLLTQFLEWLFQKLFPTKPTSLVLYRDQFIAKIAVRPWYGPNRIQIAGQLFDKVQAKYLAETNNCELMISQQNFKQAATFLTNGLTLN